VIKHPQCLKSYSKVEPDYGILTGVRVAKILIIARRQNKSREEINEILTNTYEVKEEKTKASLGYIKDRRKIYRRQNKQIQLQFIHRDSLLPFKVHLLLLYLICKLP